MKVKKCEIFTKSIFCYNMIDRNKTRKRENARRTNQKYPKRLFLGI